ncbi:WYL domain-containing protein [Novosphingobium mangrovi (ex Huang et al. 2023)]|uniref:WYL domain-containing protein n=1 Tax=Novosphingobium mangrovi (ex Huang et al. 2023) TaxID=2976432 RepID=A0ABT2I2V1_9SPHN|nr:WYL domain-containing protein [Novosphingobium mangrovi (ex Huang et al. 2023)]MCT2399127.1 WYL domain-containing protein [Novosphingobium mangrovi (ex Huang et al. 2023)]
MHNSTDAKASPERTIMEAIVRRRTICAEYNGGEMLLAPHRMFTRHGDLFVSALNLRKNWRSEEERRLGHFKLDGLSNAALTADEFEPLPANENCLPRETDQEVLSVYA